MTDTNITIQIANFLSENFDKITEKRSFIVSGKVLECSGKHNIKIGQNISILAKFGILQYPVHFGNLITATGNIEDFFIKKNGVTIKTKQLHAKQIRIRENYGENLKIALTGPLFKGIHKEKAKALIERYGDSLPNIIRNHNLDRIIKSGVLTKKSTKRLFDGWKQFDESFVLDFIRQFNISLKIAKKIKKHFKGDVVSIIKSNPYILIEFVNNWYDIDRKAIDEFKISVDDPSRHISLVTSGVGYLFKDGHTKVTINMLENKIANILSYSKSKYPQHKCQYSSKLSQVALSKLHQSRSLHIVDKTIHLSGAFIHEMITLYKLWELNHFGIHRTLSQMIMEKQINDFENKTKKKLTNEQRLAINTSLKFGASIIHGKAGTGKTTILKIICDALKKLGERIILLSVANRAVQKMIDATGQYEAYNIYMFLLLCEVGKLHISKDTTILIDESSMVDLKKAFKILNNLPIGVRLILVGDSGQLPPIDPGIFFHALVKSNFLPKTTLTYIKRQKLDTNIPIISDHIDNHVWPANLIKNYHGIGLGVSVYPCKLNEIPIVVNKIYTDLMGFDSQQNVQILSAYKKGIDGTENINVQIQNEFGQKNSPNQVAYKSCDNMSPEGFIAFNYFVGDKIIFLKKDQKKLVFKGTLGRIIEVNQNYDARLNDEENTGCGLFRVLIDNGRKVWFNHSSIAHIDLAHAITVHKAQGSEFERIIIIIRDKIKNGQLSKRYNLYDQSLIYTAITRGTRQIVLIGHIETAIKATKGPSVAQKRNVGIKKMIQEVDFLRLHRWLKNYQ